MVRVNKLTFTDNIDWLFIPRYNVIIINLMEEFIMMTQFKKNVD